MMQRLPPLIVIILVDREPKFLIGTKILLISKLRNSMSKSPKFDRNTKTFNRNPKPLIGNLKS